MLLRKRISLVVVAGCLCLGGRVARAQGGGGQFAGMERVSGEVTAVAPGSVTIKATDGGTYTVTTTDNTRVMMGRGNAAKLADLKPGDGVMAMGNLDAPKKTLHAAFVLATDAAQVKALKDNMGKTYIAGKVTAIDLDNAKMTVERQDGVTQTIGFDETTSFKRAVMRAPEGGAQPGGGAGIGGAGHANGGGGRTESITLAEVKVGDNVAGRGVLKSGTFVPAELTVLPKGMRGMRGPQP